MMKPAEKSAKAREILNSNPSDEDTLIALGLAREAAAENDAEGLFIVGSCYINGIGVERDNQKAFELLQQSLNLGYDKAKRLLAFIYARGEVVKRDLARAEQYLHNRMDQNDEVAWYYMGWMVYNNVFPHIDQPECIDYFKKAIDLGYKEAAITLAEEYETLCEPEQADYWYQKAEEAGVPGVEESRAAFTDDNYDERRHNVVNHYYNRGQYDKIINLMSRDAAKGDMYARYQQARDCARGLGNEHYGRDVQKALQLYEQLAAEGETEANFCIGEIYTNCEEVLDQQKAMDYYAKAATAGHAGAQFKMGVLWLHNIHGVKNVELAKTWIEKAAAQGQPNALYVLAANYLQDEEIACTTDCVLQLPRDEAKGLNLLQQAADAGSDNAQCCLSLCYKKGKYMEQDDKMAFKLMQASCNTAANGERVNMLGDAYRDGKGVEQDYKEAARCYQWASKNGSLQALYSLAQMYQEGKGVEQDEEMADKLMQHLHETMRWLKDDIIPLQTVKEQAENGDPDAMYQLGNRYNKGDGVEQDAAKAVELYTKAAENGNSSAAIALARLYIIGEKAGVEEDCDKAIALLQPLEESGNSAVFYFLSCAYNNKSLTKNNYSWETAEKAFGYMRKAADAGDFNAMQELANYYMRGIGVYSDVDEAKKCIQKCVDAGVTIQDDNYPEWYTDEKFEDYTIYVRYMYWQELANANIERIDNPLAMKDEDDNSIFENILENAAQLGEPNAELSLGIEALKILKTEQEKAKRYITIVSNGHFPRFAHQAGMEWLKEGIDNEDALKNALEYFSIGVEQGLVDSGLQIGLLLTDPHFSDKEIIEKGKGWLQAVIDTDDEDCEEQRQQAQERLDELERRSSGTWKKVKNRLNNLIGKK